MIACGLSCFERGPRPRAAWLRGVVAVSSLCFLLTSAAAAEKPERAKLNISGYGFLGNRELKRVLRTLELGGQRPAVFTPVFIEDAALLLSSRIRRDGYLYPEVNIELETTGGERLVVNVEELLENPLPRSLRFTLASFRIQRGPLFYYTLIEFDGLELLSEKEALSYFVETGPLFNLKRMRIYTPVRLRNSVSNLKETLQRRGYQHARVEVKEFAEDKESGGVYARIEVEEGPRTLVHSIRKEVIYPPPTPAQPVEVITPEKPLPFSRFLLQDLQLEYRTNFYAAGYPDVSVEMKPIRYDTNESQIAVDLNATVRTGEKLRVGQVRFQGNEKTRTKFLSRRVRVKRGDLLNPTRVEQGRFRLSQLGIFEQVDVTYTNTPESAPDTRDVIYMVDEGRQRQVSLLVGWGSYEMLRGGVVTDLNNLWGVAHRARLQLIQSLKSSSGEFTYTVPDFRGRDFDVFVFGAGLRREEIAFTRLEYGGGIGAHKYFRQWQTDLTLRYNYEILDASSIVPAVASEGLTNPAVGSILFDLKHDRRDNPLYPRRGYKFFTTFETASSVIGGDASYERIDTSASWHMSLGGGRWLHVGAWHGVAISFGDAAQNLPFNRRFFPGGANSIRGYQEGEASPRNADGDLVGAESGLLGTLELEQNLTPKWALVFFVDALGVARRIENYPFDEELYSAGGGIRWRTLIGPIRLEYGHNLNPRRRDPSGTIHFTLGFPF